MTSRGNLKMGNYMYNLAPKSGIFIGIAQPNLPVFRLSRSGGAKMDVCNFSYIGRIATQKHIMIIRSDTDIKPIVDIKNN
ncbi:hypothetical protein OAJ57_01205 [Alphaproteobacteria bacterium]|nr:hypothetical protein [Alphaproteobacteria bacterium]